MRKLSVVLSLLLVFVFLVAACSSGTQTVTTPEVTQSIATSVGALPTAARPTVAATAVATKAPTATQKANVTSGVPVTGATTTGGVTNLALANASRVAKLMDFNVVDQSCNRLATVNDLLVNVNNGKIMYVLVASGGFLNIGTKYIPVPWEALDWTALTTNAAGGPAMATPVAPGGTGTPAAVAGGASMCPDANVLVLRASGDSLKNAPTVDLNKFPDMSMANWDAAWVTYWTPFLGTSSAGAASTPAARGTGTPAAPAKGTPAAVASAMQVVRASELMGAAVQEGAAAGTGTSKAGTPAAGATAGAAGTIGTVRELLLDIPAGRLAYLIVAPDVSQGANLSGKFILVPLRAFGFAQMVGTTATSANSKVLTLTVPASVLAGAPTINSLDAIPDLSMAGWDTTYRAYWDKSLPAATTP